jgi:hypothetical protein
LPYIFILEAASLSDFSDDVVVVEPAVVKREAIIEFKGLYISPAFENSRAS